MADPNARLKEVRQELRRLKRKAKGEASRSTGDPWQRLHRSSRVKQTAERILLLSGGTWEPARQYLSNHFDGFNGCQDVLEEKMLHEFTHMSEAQKIQLQDCSTAASRHRQQVAQNFWEQWRLTVWVGEQNALKKVSPAGTQVLKKVDAMRPAMPACGEAVGCKDFSKTAAARKKWLQRWAKRWGLKRGLFKVGSGLSLQEAREKAGWVPPGLNFLRLGLKKSGSGGHLLGTNFAAGFRPRDQCRCT